MHYRLNPEIILEEVDDDIILLNSNKETITLVNEMSGVIIDRIRQNLSVSEIEKSIEAEYQVDPKIVGEDIENLIQELLKYDIIYPAEEA